MGRCSNNSVLAYVGLGANLGDAVEQLISARQMLYQLPFVTSGRSSSMYQSSPVGYDDQPEFINSVLELTINDQPGSETQSGSAYRALFEAMQVIESTLGRQRVAGNQNAPRVIDIDLLLYADMRIREPDLVVPHPRMHERLFVLQPLQELNPTLAKQYANTDTSVFSGQRIQRLRL